MAFEKDTMKERAVRAAERGLKTDVGYLAEGGFWLTASQAVSILAGAVLAIAFANLLPKETYGVYRYILSAASIFATATLPGLNTALTRAVAQGAGGALFPVFVARARWGTLGGLASLLGALYYFLQGNETLALAFVITALFLPFSDALNAYEAFRQGKKQFRYDGIAEMATRVIGMLAMLAALFLSQDVIVLVAIYFAVYAALRLIFFLHTLAASRGERAPHDEERRSLFAYGRHLSVLYVIAAVAAQLDKIAVFHFAGAAALAAYSFALLVPDQLRSSVKHVANLAFPKFATRPLPEVLAGLPGKNALLGAAVALIVLAYALAAPLLFSLLFPAYDEAIILTQLLALTLVDALTLLPLSALRAHGKTETLYRYQIVVSLVQVALIWAGGELAGLMGIIAGLVAGRVIAVAYLWLLVRAMKSAS